MPILIINDKCITTPLYQIIMDIRNSLHNGKLRIVEKKGNNIKVTCPHHKNGLEGNADCYIYDGDPIYNKKGELIVDYGYMNCFACGEKGPFWHFVAECFDESDEWAKSWLLDNYFDALIDYLPILPPIEISDSSSDIKLLEESCLSSFQNYHPYMTKRKISREVIDKFELKYDPQSKCIVFPVRDEKGRLTLLTRRSVENKYFFIDENSVKPIYLLYYLKKYNCSEAIICESQINALTCQSYGLPGVALFGTGDSNQYDILNKSGIFSYILCFDGDDAGDKGIRNFLKNIKKTVIVSVIKMPRGKDVNDLSKEEFFNLALSQGIDLESSVERYNKCLNKNKQ